MLKKKHSFEQVRKEHWYKVTYTADNSILENTLDADYNVWRMTIDAAAFVALMLMACE